MENKTWIIAKEFDFCYGHRVWSQQLIEGYSTDTCLKCRHLHGHQGKIIVKLQAEKLENGMVTDFKHLGWFKTWLDDVLDHKFIMDINDPLLDHEFPEIAKLKTAKIMKEYLTYIPGDGYWIVADELLQKLSPVIREKYEGMVFSNFVPTSENLSEWLFKIVKTKMEKINIKTHSVVLYETPKSSSTYMCYE